MTSPPRFQLPNWLDVAARSHPNRLALMYAENRWSYADLQRSACYAATILSLRGSEKARRIGVLSANRPGFVFAVHAAMRLATPVVPLNWRQTSGEIAWQLQDSGITVLLVDEERFTLAETACVGLPVEIVPIADLEQAPESIRQPIGALSLDLSREAAVIYTSGTSGRPKGARITYGNFWFSAIASKLHLGHRSDDIWLAAMPLFHVGGLSILFRGVIGALPIILENQFDPDKFMTATEGGATLVSVVPTMLQRILESRGDAPWPSSVRCVLVGGSSTPPELAYRCSCLGIPIAPTYGLTEFTSQVTTLLPHEVRSKPASSGLPLPLSEVRVFTSAGNAAVEEIGSIEIRGPALFAGYLNNTDAQSGTVSDGWFVTGDAGYLDDEGYLFVIDRRDDLIVSGGENVYPAEVERVLREHPSVVDAGVISVIDKDWGSRPTAAVVWRGAPESAAPDLRRHCEERLAKFKIPVGFHFYDELPRSPSGKLLRRTLREQIVNMQE